MSSTGALREIVTLFGVDVDKGSFDRADAAVEKLRRGAEILGTIFVTGVVARGIAKFVEMASDVEQTTALMADVFTASAGDVEAWSRQTAAAVGRSEFELQRFASSVGAMVAPLLGAGEETAKLSQDMAQAALDIAAVFNTTDEAAMTAIRSGLAGETEPLRRFGVVLTQAALEEFALSQGIGRTIQEMTEAEKVQLRYNFILARTSLFAGRAARESREYAGATKALQAALTDLAVRIGTILLPAATQVVNLARDALRRFLQLAEGTKILETALIVLGAAGTAVAIQMLLPFLPVLAMWGAMAAAIGAVIIVAEDLWQFFTGGISLTGELLEQLEGRFPGLGEKVQRFKDIAVAAWEDLRAVFGKFVDFALPKLEALFEADWGQAIEDAVAAWDRFRAGVADFIESPVGKALIAILGAWLGKKIGEFAGGLGGEIFEALGSADPTGRKYGALPRAWASMFGAAGEGAGGAVGAIVGALKSGNLTAGLAGLIRPGSQANMASNVTVNQTINAAPGQDEAAVGEAAAQQAANFVALQNRQALRASVPWREGPE